MDAFEARSTIYSGAGYEREVFEYRLLKPQVVAAARTTRSFCSCMASPSAAATIACRSSTCQS